MSLKVFHDHPGFPDIEDATKATPSERIESIGRFIEQQTARFQSTLKPRERANCGYEDTIDELVVKLLEKDSEWNPERGKYITFAGKIIEREFCTLRERARVVPSPRNSSGRMREYLTEEAAGTITRRRAKTANDIRRTTASPASLSTMGMQGDGARETIGFQVQDHRTAEPPDAADANESMGETLDALKSAIKHLPPFEAFVLGHLGGLWGTTKKSVHQIAWECRRDEEEIRKVRARAICMVRSHLLSIHHPVTTK